MDFPEIERLKRLEKLAEADEVYQIWRSSRREFTAAFEKFADSQPEEIRNFLWGYAAAGDMMFQRKLLLACRNMEFMDKE